MVEPLERGSVYARKFVRRALLSSLKGSAVWAFRIDGVVHEHQTIPGVVEDVHQVIQNLKSLVVTLDDDVDDVVLKLNVDKAGIVTAGMIQAPAGSEVMDEDHHLFTLQEDRSLGMELYVNKGRFCHAWRDSEGWRVGQARGLGSDRFDYNPVRRANSSSKRRE